MLHPDLIWSSDSCSGRKMARLKHFLRKNTLLLLALSGVVLGFLLGAILKACNLSATGREIVGYPGELFFRALQMLILPIIIVSLVAASSTLNIKENGRIAMRTFTYFFLTSLFNAFLGVLLVVTIRPGSSDRAREGLQQAGAAAAAGMAAAMGGAAGKMKPNSMTENMMDLGRNIIPDNMFTTLFEITGTMHEAIPLNETVFIDTKKLVKMPGTNVLGVIMLALTFGAVLSTLKDKAAQLIDLFKVFELVVTKLLRALIWALPVGVASIIAAKMLEVPNIGHLMSLLALFTVTVFVGLAIYQLLFLQLLYFLIIHKNPYRFYLDMLPAAAAGFAGQSSSIALPVTLQCIDERTKIDFRVSRFVIPLGVIMNMDGTALFVTVASVFIAQLNDISLSFVDYMTICMSATAVSVAAATTPSSSILLLFMILSAIGVPPSSIGLLLAVDWLLDRLRITNNVLGDCYGAAIVQHLSRHELKDIDGLAVSTTEFTDTHVTTTDMDEVELK